MTEKLIIYWWNEKWLAFLAIIWGIILALPGDLFAGLERYRLIAQLFPDWVWGAIMFLSGVALLLKLPMLTHKHIHFVLTAVWLGMTLLSVLATKTPPALLITSLCLTIAMFHVGKFWRIQHP